MKTKVTTQKPVLFNPFTTAVCTGATLLLAGSVSAQNLFVSDGGYGNAIIYEYTPDGTQFIFASGISGPFQPDPLSLAFDGMGNLYAADYSNSSIDKFTPDGVETTFASNVYLTFTTGLAFNSAGDLFTAVVNGMGFSIAKFTPDGTRSTFASFNSYFAQPAGLAFNSSGDLLVQDWAYGNLIDFAPDGTLISSVPYLPGGAPWGLAFNSAGNLFVSRESTGDIYEFPPDMVPTVYASGLGVPRGLAFDGAGNLFTVDEISQNVVEINPNGGESVFASGLENPVWLAFAPPPAPNQPTAYVGNPALPFANYAAPDGVPPLVIMGEYNPAGPSPTTAQPLPSGVVQDVKFYGQNYDFTLYAVEHVAAGPGANEQVFEVVSSERFSGNNANPGTITLAVSNFRVKAGDFLAFSGTGPWYPQQPNDALNTDATYEDAAQPDPVNDNDTATPPVLGELFSVGLNRDPNATYGYIADNFGNQGRIYAIGVDIKNGTVSYSGANLQKADLSGQNLQGVNFANANLQKVDFQGANLLDTDLAGVNLQNANLAGVLLAGANLASANLQNADLAGADLSGAELTGAHLQGANLQNANFTDANLTGANLHGANLTGAIFTGATITGCSDCP